MPSDSAEQWLKALIDIEPDDEMSDFAMMQMVRHTGDRYRDVEAKLRDKTIARLERRDAASHYIELARHGGQLDQQERAVVFGEALPIGLRLGAS